MAERSFAHEIGKLKLGAGALFRGEGILAVTKALLQSGVAYVGGYQGAPVSHLIDVFNDARDYLDELGVHFEHAASEASAAAMLGASIAYPLRGAVAWKSVVGTNVASDALANLASAGVTGGALIVIGEDYGQGASIMQERTHAFAMTSQIWLLDPPPNLPAIAQAVEDAFELSEASHTPVMLMLRVRACHVRGQFLAKDNVAPRYTLRQALESPRRDLNNYVQPPANFLHERDKIERRWPAAIAHIRNRRLNRSTGDASGRLGLILQGGLYNTVLRALWQLGQADLYGRSRLPIYVLNVTYPLIEAEIIEFCAGRDAVLVLEEGQPEFIEHNIASILRRAGLNTRIVGKDLLPRAGEYSGAVLATALREFLGLKLEKPAATVPAVPALQAVVPARPPGLCIGCPERPVFAAIKLLERELGEFHVSGDIGCHSFASLPPFNLGSYTMGYGLGVAGASALNVPAGKRALSFIGDGGFWHNGLTSGVASAVFNRSDNVTVVFDNGYAAGTGGQDVPSSRATLAHRDTGKSIENAVSGVGVDWVKTVTTYDVESVRGALREALTTRKAGPKVIVAQSECMLNKQRRERPQVKQKIARGERHVRERFGVDPETCTGDHSCIRLSACPSLTVRANPDPLREDPVAYVDNDCVGCGLCGANAHAAVLCPSFFRAEILHNPTRWDRWRARINAQVIGWWQRREERRRCALGL